MKLLHIDSSIMGDTSVSRQLTRNVVHQWLASHPATEVDYLDLAQNSPSHLSAESLGFRLPPQTETLTEVQRRENAVSEALVTQFLAADTIVIGAPLYNFSVPSQLKAWIDRIAQAGRTFTYTDKGPKGLAGGKTVIAVITRGGVYSTSDAGRAMEHQESYLQTIFGFLGITDVRFVHAEGLAMGESGKANGLATAAAETTVAVKASANQELATEAA